MTNKAAIWLKKNGLLLIVILALCVSIVSFSMGLVLISKAKYSTSNLSLEVTGKERVDFEDTVILKTEITNDGGKDILSIGFVIEMKDRDGNLLGEPSGTLNFTKNNDGLLSKETEHRDLEYTLDFDKYYDKSWYIYNMPYEDIEFSVRVEWINYMDGEKTDASNESDMAWLEAQTTGIIVAGCLLGLAAGCFVYIQMKKVMAISGGKPQKGK